MTSTTESLESLEKQMKSLARVVLQNKSALDLLSAEHGKTCLVLGKEYCFYVNKSDVVKLMSTLSKNDTKTYSQNPSLYNKLAGSINAIFLAPTLYWYSDYAVLF